MSALDKYPLVTRDGIEFHADRRGWPVETCGRCRGSGTYSYCQMYGDTCFGCSGRCVVLSAGKAAQEAADYREAVQRMRGVVGYNMAPGDAVRRHGAKDDPYLTVVSSEDTGKWCGSSRVGNAPEVVYTYRLVTFDDGTSVQAGPELWTRRGTVDRAPYVERAQAAHVAKVKRSQRKSVPA